MVFVLGVHAVLLAGISICPERFCYQNAINLQNKTPNRLIYQVIRGFRFYSHSIVAGGLLVTS